MSPLRRRQRRIDSGDGRSSGDVGGGKEGVDEETIHLDPHGGQERREENNEALHLNVGPMKEQSEEQAQISRQCGCF